MNTNIRMGRPGVLLISALAVIAVAGLFLILPAHAQTVTTSGSIGSTNTNPAGYPGHNCPDMGTSSSTYDHTGSSSQVSSG